jgi:hypothetical protein
MYKYLFVLLLLLSKITVAQVKNDTVKNETVIKMAKAKLGNKIIIQKINNSPCKFDVSTDALIKLKENFVSDTIVDLMVLKQSNQESEIDNNSSKNSDGGTYTFKESGIYFKKGSSYVPLDPTIVTSGQVTGFATTKYRSQIEGSEANYQLKSNVIFYFNFEPIKKRLNNSNANSNTSNESNYMHYLQNSIANTDAQAVSPNEFKLVKLDVTRNKRQYTTTKVNLLGKFDISVDDRNLVNFKYEKVSSHTYKITFPEGLEPGEYCFIYLSQSNNTHILNYGQNNLKVFDFGIIDENNTQQ